jgi:hypothetical protein
MRKHLESVAALVDVTNKDEYFFDLLKKHQVSTVPETSKGIKHKKSRQESESDSGEDEDDDEEENDNMSTDMLVKNPDAELTDEEDVVSMKRKDKGYRKIQKVPESFLKGGEKIGQVLFVPKTHRYYLEDDATDGLYQRVDQSGSGLVKFYQPGDKTSFILVAWRGSLRRRAGLILLKHFANVAGAKTFYEPGKSAEVKITKITKQFYKYRYLSIQQAMTELNATSAKNIIDCLEPRFMSEIENYLAPPTDDRARDPAELEYRNGMFGIVETIRCFVPKDKVAKDCPVYYEWQNKVYDTFGDEINRWAAEREDEFLLREGKFTVEDGIGKTEEEIEQLKIDARQRTMTQLADDYKREQRTMDGYDPTNELRYRVVLESLMNQAADNGTRVHLVVERAMKSIPASEWFIHTPAKVESISKRLEKSVQEQQETCIKTENTQLLTPEESANVSRWIRHFFRWLNGYGFVCFCPDLTEIPFARRKYMVGGQMDFIFIRRVRDELFFVAMDLKCGKKMFEAMEGNFVKKTVSNHMNLYQVPLGGIRGGKVLDVVVDYAFQLGTYRRTLENKNGEFLNIGQVNPFVEIDWSKVRSIEDGNWVKDIDWKHLDRSKLKWSKTAYNVLIHPLWEGFTVVEIDLATFKTALGNPPQLLSIVDHVNQAFLKRLKQLRLNEKKQ